MATVEGTEKSPQDDTQAHKTHGQSIVPHNHAAEDCGTSAASATRKHEQAEQLMARSKALYTQGLLSMSFKAICDAHKLWPESPQIVARYAVGLMRHGRDHMCEEVIRSFELKHGPTDPLMLVEGEMMRRRGRYAESIAVLSKVMDRKTYQVHYELGLCYLLKAASEQTDSANGYSIRRATDELRVAHGMRENYWWITCNLLFAYRYVGVYDDMLADKARMQIQTAIQIYPFKASARVYRLFMHAFQDDHGAYVRQIDTDIAEGRCQMEVPADISYDAELRIRLMKPQKWDEYVKAFNRWYMAFAPVVWVE